MKISYVTRYDALDIHNWSGLGYSIAKMLENQDTDIQYIGNLETKVNFINQLQGKICGRIFGKKFDKAKTPFVAKKYAEQVKARLSADTDIVFSVGSIVTALLETEQPKVFYTDATFAGMLDFYDSFKNFCPLSVRYGNQLESRALHSADLVIYSSDWAAKTAVDNYGVNADKIKVVPFGANMTGNKDFDSIKEIVNRRSEKELNLLFIGGDWKRKGGNAAIAVAQKLNDLGLKTKLHIVGIKEMPFENIPDFVVHHGYISKRTKEGMDKMERLFMNSHFLILPTIADCTPVVYSEANAYGLPALSTNVGGISTIIKDEINGKKFAPDAPPVAWSSYIADTFTDRAKYNEMCLSSFNEYENRLNWNVAGKTIMKMLREL